MVIVTPLGAINAHIHPLPNVPTAVNVNVALAVNRNTVTLSVTNAVYPVVFVCVLHARPAIPGNVDFNTDFASRMC
jgi:hypothetical protein